MFLPPTNDKVWNTACAANDRNILMTEKVNNFIWYLCKYLWLCEWIYCNLCCWVHVICLM